MRLHLQQKFHVFKDWVAFLFDGPQALAFLPAMVLGGFWLGGEPVLLVMALGVPFCVALGSYSGLALPPRFFETWTTETPIDRDSFAVALDLALRNAQKTGRSTACFAVELGGLEALEPKFGPDAARNVRAKILKRLNTVMRERDCTCLLADNQVGFVISPLNRVTNETGLQLAKRVKHALETAGGTNAQPARPKVSIGFAISDPLEKKNGPELLDAAMLALKEARKDRATGIRAFVPATAPPPRGTAPGESRVVQALENGEIIPWFQPQVSNETGQISGFEALARWRHPQRGIIPPAEFLPMLERAGQLERLGEIILHHSCETLKAWDDRGLVIPKIGVNFTIHELSNPRLIDKIAWELDRCNLAPDRICVEILETVLATSADDVLTRNIRRLADMGFGVDLDDFGTAHASMTSIRRFPVQRLKIDRTFVSRVDRDPDQQRMVSAILMMAEQLDLDTLAEGVETAGEHALLAQLGCGHVQGFGIGRPMPYEDTIDWVLAHRAKLTAPPVIGRKTGGNRP